MPSKKKCQNLIGTSGWSYDDWLGRFYPQNCSKKYWLEYYASQFNTVELNATFYHHFSQKVFKNWHDRTPKNFQFIVKLPRYITHTQRLINIKSGILKAEKAAAPLQDKLALFLMQLPPNIAYQPERLERALSAFSDSSRVVVEFRNEKWITPEVKKILKDYKAIFCNVDSPSIQIYNELTSKIAYIRLHGHSRMYNYNYTITQLTKIVDATKDLIKKGASKIYIFFNNDHYANAPRNAKKLEGILNKSLEDNA